MLRQFNSTGLALGAVAAAVVLVAACDRSSSNPVAEPSSVAVRATPASAPPAQRASEVSPGRPVLRAGISLEDLQTILLQRGPINGVWPEPPVHQLTVMDRATEEVTTVVAATIGHASLRYYFILCDGHLDRVVAESDLCAAESGAEVQGLMPVRQWYEAAARSSEELLAAPAIPLEQFEQDVSRRLGQRALAFEAGSASAGVPGLTPEAIERYASLKARLDPLQIRCGMKMSDLEMLLGTALRIEAFEGHEVYVYGSADDIPMAPPAILVGMREEVVESVFTSALFHLGAPDLRHESPAHAGVEPPEG